MHSFGYRVFAIASLLTGLAFAAPHAQDDVNVTGNPTIKATRTTNTCADPSLAQTFFQAYAVGAVEHQLNFLEVFETVNSGNAATIFTNEHPAFNAWPTQQDFTSPLFVLGNSNEVTYALGADAQTPPVVNGFAVAGIIAWVYSTQVCGSVPLMSATLPGASDNYYTIDPLAHSRLIAGGWSDTGVVAFVLPLSYSYVTCGSVCL